MRDAESAICAHRDGALLEIRVHSSSSRRGLGEASAGRIAVYVHSSPEKGRANKEALKVLSGALGVPASHFGLVRGRTSRNKTVLVRGLSPDQVKDLLADGGAQTEGL